MGVVVTALVQSSVAGLGLLIAGIPYTMVPVIVVMFLLIVAGIGPFPVLLSCIGYLYWSSSVTHLGHLPAGVVADCGHHGQLPASLPHQAGAEINQLVLILVGVIGGLLTMGIIGLFIGPVVLAVGYTLLDAWIKEGESQPEPTRSD